MRVTWLAILSAAAGTAYAADHYAKISEVERFAAENGCESAATVLRARWDVADAQCQAGLYKTSLPAKQILTFSLEGRAYTLYVPVSTPRPMADAPKRKGAPDRGPDRP